MKKAPRNRSITLSKDEINQYCKKCIQIKKLTDVETILNKTIRGDVFKIIKYLPEQCVDLLVVDPPYNLSKTFNKSQFNKLSIEGYAQWLDSWLSAMVSKLKPSASLYICGDWYTSTSIHLIAEKYFKIRNRITWEREKGRGSQSNWKNCSEDIWFCTMSNKYVYNVNDVKLKRKVIAPYIDSNGNPKDWEKSSSGNFRLTYPSNLMTDISVPFWSMPENTDHPTQKPEKLIAKLILASSNPGDVVLDPFVGSGTTSVVAKKLGRNYIGIEKDKKFCAYTEKRLEMADQDQRIQGYQDNVFWERNSNNDRVKHSRSKM